MAKIYTIAQDRNSITYGVQGYPDLTMVVKTNRSPKTAAGGKKLTNAVSEVQVNATVGVRTCDDKSCAQESLSHRQRLSGSMQNAEKRAALSDIAKKAFEASNESFRAGESMILPTSLDIDGEVAILYPSK